MTFLQAYDIIVIWLIAAFLVAFAVRERQKQQRKKEKRSPIRITPKIGYPVKRGKFSEISPVSTPPGPLPGMADFDAMRKSYGGGKKLAFTIRHRPDQILKIEIKPCEVSATLCYIGPDRAGDLTALEFDSDNQLETLERFFYRYYLDNNLSIPHTQLLAYPKLELVEDGRLYYSRSPNEKYYLLGINQKAETRVERGLLLTRNGAEWSVQRYPISLHSVIVDVVAAKEPISISAYDILVPEEDLAKYDKVSSCGHVCPSAQIPVVHVHGVTPVQAPPVHGVTPVQAPPVHGVTPVQAPANKIVHPGDTVQHSN